MLLCMKMCKCVIIHYGRHHPLLDAVEIHVDSPPLKRQDPRMSDLPTTFLKRSGFHFNVKNHTKDPL